MARFGGSAPEDIGGFESFIMKFRRNGTDLVLRLAHTIRRTPEMILGEVQWIRYLAGNGVPVADAVESLSGNLVEEIPDGAGGSFLATSFRMVRGKTPWEYGWNPELFSEYGRLLGKMHRLSRGYAPSVDLRPNWNSSSLGGDLVKMIPEDQQEVRSRMAALEEEALCLPATRDSYGLVHYDAHGGNMLIGSSGEITLFDFDDCCMSWFANDIAIVLFYMITNVPEPEIVAGKFLQPFFTGYSEENTLDPVWLESIPLFLSLREIDMYAVIHRSMDPGNLGGWCRTFMKGRREKLAKGTPYLHMDFSRFSSLLI
jgi:amicoumacin kinase